MPGYKQMAVPGLKQQYGYRHMSFIVDGSLAQAGPFASSLMRMPPTIRR